jgi:hypothetical protein
VNFIDNGGLKYPDGDFDFNNLINSADWLSFIADAETDILNLSRALRYQAGDLNGDGFNSIADFVAFKALYDAANGGAGAFDAMIAGLNIPEPTSAVLLGMAATLLALRRRRHAGHPRKVCSTSINDTSAHSPGDFTMPSPPWLCF